MNRTTFQVGTFEVNCSIISENDKAIVVDPGAEATRIRAELKKQGLGLAAVLLTHAHFDHISAIPELQRAYPDLPVFISDADALRTSKAQRIWGRSSQASAGRRPSM